MLRVSLASTVSLLALAITAPTVKAAEDQAFSLGQIEQIVVSAQAIQQRLQPMSQSVVSSEEMYKFNEQTLDRAIDLVPGAVSSNTGGNRNERLIFVRGFDRFQVPLSIDGIRVYLPADNRLDYGLFLTADLAQIQVQKGYVSVLDGPGGMGGAINLVTKQPTQPFEWDVRGGMTASGDLSANGYTGYASAGSKQEKYYVHVSGALTDMMRWSLSDRYVPTATENGGFRDHSLTKNWRVNAKAGYTPNDSDEYSLSFTQQSGKKDAPFSVTDTVASQRDWRWPYWDVQSIYFLSTTALGQNMHLKTKAYYNTFKNGLESYDDATYTTQKTAKAFSSPYDDNAYGGSLELDADLAPSDTIKVAAFYRRDHHEEAQTTYAPTLFVEPVQTNEEDTYSIALENRFHVTPQLDFVAGGSYDYRDLRIANDFASNAFVYYALKDAHAWNGQAALIYNIDPTTNVYANVSDRTRFPTVFERFSSRFGGSTSNPGLKPERAVNTEIGGGTQLFGNTKASVSLYYNDVTDVIVSVPIVANGTNVNQSQNVGNGHYYGAEFSIDSHLADHLDLAVRYSTIKRVIHNPVNAAFRLTGVPSNQIFAYLTYGVMDRVSISPSVLAASDRWTVTTNGATYFRTGAYVQANLQADIRVTSNADISFGARNLFDENHQLTAGFPEEGRNFFLNLRIRG